MCKYTLVMVHSHTEIILFYVLHAWHVILLACPKSSLIALVDRVAYSRIHCHSADSKYVEYVIV